MYLCYKSLVFMVRILWFVSGL